MSFKGINMVKRIVYLLFTALVATASMAAETSHGDRLILVTGATGHQGGAVARELLRRGYRVRGLTRHPESDKAQALSKLGVEMVRGDFDDTPSLDLALRGAYGTFAMQNWVEAGTKGEIRQGKAFADAAKRAGIKHFVYTSVAAAGHKTGIEPFDTKYEIENYIRKIGLPYTIIRPVSFMTNFDRNRTQIQKGTMSGVMAPDHKTQYIAVSDIGRFAADALDDPAHWLGRVIVIAGDEKSNAEVAQIFSRVIGRPVKYQQIPWETFTKNAPPAMVKAVEYYRKAKPEADVAALRREFPWMLTLEEYLRANNWGNNN